MAKETIKTPYLASVLEECFICETWKRSSPLQVLQKHFQMFADESNFSSGSVESW